MVPLFTRVTWVALATALVVWAAPALATITPLDFSVANDTDVRSVLLEEGALLLEEGEAILACQELYGNARWLLWTGHAGHSLAVGDDGVWLTSEGGCHWRRTTGAVDGQRVVGVYQPQDGGDRVLFATDDPFGGTKVVQTVDGGFTSTLAGEMAVGDVVFSGMAGRDDVVVILGHEEEGALRAWWSDDAGDTFTDAGDLGRIVGPDFSVAGFDGERAWFWDEGALIGLSPSGELDDGTPVFAEGRGVVAGAGDGVTWLAAGDEGLWRRTEDGAWELAQPDPTTSVKMAYGRIWVARSAAHAGEPLILRSADGGETWWTALAVPDGWGYPEACQSSVSQICRDASDALRAALGLPDAEWVPEPEDQAQEPSEPAAEEGCASAGGGGQQAPLLLLLAALLAWARGPFWRPRWSSAGRPPASYLLANRASVRVHLDNIKGSF